MFANYQSQNRFCYSIVVLLVSPKVVVNSVSSSQTVLPAAPVIPVLHLPFRFQLSCSAIGAPPIYIAIKRNSLTLLNKTNTASIRVSEEGNYICQATSKYGTDKREFVVITGEDNQIISFTLILVGAMVNDQSFLTRGMWCCNMYALHFLVCE